MQQVWNSELYWSQWVHIPGRTDSAFILYREINRKLCVVVKHSLEQDLKKQGYLIFRCMPWRSPVFLPWKWGHLSLFSQSGEYISLCSRFSIQKDSVTIIHRLFISIGYMLEFWEPLDTETASREGLGLYSPVCESCGASGWPLCETGCWNRWSTALIQQALLM